MRIATYKVTCRETGAEMVVNASDFDESKHKRVTKGTVKQSDSKSKAEPDSESKPSRGRRGR